MFLMEVEFFTLKWHKMWESNIHTCNETGEAQTFDKKKKINIVEFMVNRLQWSDNSLNVHVLTRFY